MGNAVTAILVEIAVVRAKEDKDEYMVNQLRELIVQMDKDASGQISWPEFKGSLTRKQMRDYFKAIEVDTSEAKGVFSLLDMNNNGHIDTEDFLSGCLRLRGPAKSMDLLLLTQETRRMISKQFNMLKALAESVRGMDRARG